MVGKDFIYNGKVLSDFGLVMVNPDGQDSWGLEREIIKGETNPYKTTPNIYDVSYTGTIILNFLFIPDLCNSEKIDIDYYELRRFTSWLTSPRNPLPLYIQFDGEPNQIYDGIWTSVTSSEYNGLTGLYATFTTNSPFAYNIRRFSIENSNPYMFYSDSDDFESLEYPTIKIENIKYAGEFEIRDTSNKQMFKFKTDTLYKEIIIDCKNKRIIGDGQVLSYSEIGLGVNIYDQNNIDSGMVKINWPVVYPGKNEWQYIGTGELNVEYRVPLKVGAFTDV